MLALLLAGAAFFGGRHQPPTPISQASNGWIAVSANRAGLGNHFGDIYLLSEGNPARRIIGSDGDALAKACPRFSPDGQRLVYGEADNFSAASNERGRWPVANRAVVVVGINDHGDASEPIARVALPTYPGEIPCPEWSPNGTQVAFRVGSELWVADATSGKTTVFQAVQADWGQNGLEWSRDGSRIAVSEPGEIGVVPVDGSAATAVPTWGSTPGSLGWLADDKKIVYVYADSSGDGLAVHVVGDDGSNDIQLTPDASSGGDLVFHSSVVSPDGTRIAYTQQTVSCTSGSCTLEPQRLVTVNPDGSNLVEVPARTEITPNGLQWSPDGKRLLFGSGDVVASVDATTGSPVLHSNRELDMEWTASELTWQPVHP